mgnify:CR=1 FL=1|jgi:hypothetical protein
MRNIIINNKYIQNKDKIKFVIIWADFFVSQPLGMPLLKFTSHKCFHTIIIFLLS